jgi:imidazolonepropionase-like amidohydrolase
MTTRPDCLIRDVRVFDGEQVLDANAVVIRAGRITRAGTGIPAQPGIEVAGGRGGILLPGLISAPGIVRGRRAQETGDEGREQARAGHQLDVAAVVDVQRRVRDARG